MPGNFVLLLFRIWYNQKCDSLFIYKEEERLYASKSFWAHGQKKKKKKSGLYKESLRGYRRGSEAFASITEITFL